MTIKTTFHDVGDDTFVINRVQDATKFLDYAHAVRTADVKHSDDMKEAAFFPDAVVENYIATNGITWHEFLTNQDHVKRMLNSPDLSGFRVWEGKV